jgi:hypothetical protein
MEDELRQAEAEPLAGAEEPGETVPLTITPAESLCYVDDRRSLTIVAARHGLRANTSVVVRVEPQGIIECLDGFQLTLEPHPRRDDLLLTRLRIQALSEGHALIECEVAGRIAQAVIEVQGARTPAEPSHAATVIVPSAFEFEQDRYQLKWTQTKVLRLRAPTGTCEPGTLVSVTGNAPGITILRNSIAMGAGSGLGILGGPCQHRSEGSGGRGHLDSCAWSTHSGVPGVRSARLQRSLLAVFDRK